MLGLLEGKDSLCPLHLLLFPQSLHQPCPSLEASAKGVARAPRRGQGRSRGSNKKVGTMVAVASPPSAPRHGRPLGSKNKKTLAALAVAAGATGSAVATVASVGPSQFRLVLPPAQQPPAYTSVSWYTTFIVLVLARCGDRLCLPS
jgi:hypothetical protein